MAENLVRTFRFQVTLVRSAQLEAGSVQPATIAQGGAKLGTGGFQEVSGLQIEHDIQEYQEGGRNDSVIRRPGRAKYANLVLKRGIFFTDDGTANRDLWMWIQDVVAGKRPLPRYDGIVEVYSHSFELVAKWEFYRGLPAQLKGPELNAKTGDVAVEELHIAHEGLKFVAI